MEELGYAIRELKAYKRTIESLGNIAYMEEKLRRLAKELKREKA